MYSIFFHLFVNPYSLFILDINPYLLFILDINECQRGVTDCFEHAECTNTDGGYTCSCKVGWYGDGITCESKQLIDYFHLALLIVTHRLLQ